MCQVVGLYDDFGGRITKKEKINMAVVSKKSLLETGVHFGHITKRWDPRMKPYIYTKRNGIYIIDLKKTAQKIEEAYAALFEIAKNGGRVIFVGTKKQAHEAVKSEAIRCGQFYVNKSWKGGTLTNKKTIDNSIKKLHKLEKMEKDGIIDTAYTKKEAIQIRKEMAKLENAYGGIKDMKGLPQAIFVVDPKVEANAVAEAKKLNIPVFGIVDTNCDPGLVDYVIPANDDAIRAVQLVTQTMANAVLEANGQDVPKFDDNEELFDGSKKGDRPPRKPYNKGDRDGGNRRPYNGDKKPYNGDRKPYNKDNRKPAGEKRDSAPKKEAAPKAEATTTEEK